MDIDEFTTRHAPTTSEQPFALETEYTLDVAVDGSVSAKAGSMVAYEGDLSFTGRASASGGITGFLKEAATGEGTPVMTVEGTGNVYLADDGKKVQVITGPGAVAITTHGSPVVFEPPVTTDPSATVAWSRTTPNVEVNRSLADVVGQESGERLQMRFDGTDGFVVVQPYEERGGP
jgi:uncharacterized protein (AIM24 family)